MILNKKEREFRKESIRAALTSDAVLDTVVDLVEAHLANDDCNDDDADEREREALRAFMSTLGYSPDEDE